MRYPVEKLERLNYLTKELTATHRQAIKQSDKLRDMSLQNSTQKQRENLHMSMINNFTHVDKLSVMIYEIVEELGFADIARGEVIIKDGWHDQSTVRGGV